MQEIQETRRLQSLDCGNPPWRKEWQPAPVFLPGKSHGRRRLAGYSPGGCKESDVTERLSTAQVIDNVMLVSVFSRVIQLYVYVIYTFSDYFPI